MTWRTIEILKFEATKNDKSIQTIACNSLQLGGQKESSKRTLRTIENVEVRGQEK
jgi:hypothetical protein